MGALFMGNRPLVHVDKRVSLVFEEFIRLAHHCGLPRTDLDYLHGQGPHAQRVLVDGNARLTQFTGSSVVGEHLASVTRGKVKLEDAGFDWKVLGPDARAEDVPHVAWQCDQDAYAASGQKCSATSFLAMHENWRNVGLVEALREKASQRSLTNLTVGPLLSWTDERLRAHVDAVCSLAGAKILFGGRLLRDVDPQGTKRVPTCYGLLEPTAVFVPLSTLAGDPTAARLATQELFGPFQIVTEYHHENLDALLHLLEGLSHHLTAAVVSRDPDFTSRVLMRTTNGTTYAGIRARTTGAPQNHWFGPGSDPRGAGIGTIEAIRSVWSYHREIISDVGPTWTDADQKFIQS
jgi:1-pyrroline-5-carboxylate dehydrogenase